LILKCFIFQRLIIIIIIIIIITIIIIASAKHITVRVAHWPMPKEPSDYRAKAESTGQDIIGFNDLIWRMLSTSIPAVKEPTGLLRSGGKRPDTLNGRRLTWNVTATGTLALSVITSSLIRHAAWGKQRLRQKEKR